MDQGNVTSVKSFIFLGFSHLPHLRLFFISIFSLFYIFTLLGNILIILLTLNVHQLHTPMYFFLANFSLVDILFSSVTEPKMIWDLVFMDGVISLLGCLAQMYFFINFGATECFILSVMAFDRYVAICNPFHYMTIMNKKMCYRLVGGTWFIGSINSLIHTILTNNIDFCGPNHINHFFCDLLPLFQLACSDISLNIAVIFVSLFCMAVCNCCITLTSYAAILCTIFRIKSTEGRRKAFSTCASHLMVVSMFYGTVIITYSFPNNKNSMYKDRTAAIIYTTVTPALNPIIYTLRNTDVKKALKKLLLT
ncbi:olfactory receptor 5V1-like [Rhinophrynus dorsalis]